MPAALPRMDRLFIYRSSLPDLIKVLLKSRAFSASSEKLRLPYPFCDARWQYT